MKAPDKHIAITFPPTLLLLLLMAATISFSTVNAQSNHAKDGIDGQNKSNYVITKTTSVQKLDSIVTSLDQIGFLLEYKNLYYNNDGEITSISLLYKDSNLNAGQYAVSSEQPINDIVISISDDRVVISSKGEGNSAFASQRQQNDAFHHPNMEDVENRRAQMHQRMENRRKQAEEKRKRRLSQVHARRKQIRDEHVNDAAEDNNFEYLTITKNSTESELDNLKKLYADEGILFSCNDVRRNSNGEITHIYITIANGHDTISSTGFGNGESPIHNIFVGVDSSNVVVRNNKQTTKP